MTRIGLLSDTHGDDEIAREAVALLVARGAELLIHLGDVGGEAVVDALAVGMDADGKLKPPAHLVFGNTDDDAAELGRYAELLGIGVHHPAGRLVIDGKTIVFTHGHYHDLMREAIKGGADYLLHGHTHRQQDQTVQKTRVINPGALHRAAVHTVALLDVTGGGLEFLEV